MEKFLVRKKSSSVQQITESESARFHDRNSISISGIAENETNDFSKVEYDGLNALKSSRRNYRPDWINQFPFIVYDGPKDVIFCKLCQEAYRKKLLKFSTRIDFAFIETGFSNWKKATEKLRAHEKSACHRESVSKMTLLSNPVNVMCQLSDVKKQQMNQARFALLKIISSYRFLVAQGLAVRGHTDDKSNFSNLLQLRAEDSAELKRWLSRDSYKWCSHDVGNEIMEIMSHAVLRKLINDIKDAKYFSIILDETADVSVKEQVSVCFRIVTSALEIEEIFVGFYSTDSTSSREIFNILMDVLKRFNLSVYDCRGQCFDGAANMAGIHSGVQARLSQIEPRALFVHCLAHCLNLAVHDSVKNINGCRNTLNSIRDIVSFVKSSPKRLAFFTQLQSDESVNLRPLCPTRWTVRFSSLSAICSNYSDLIEFMSQLSLSDKSEVGAKADGFSTQLQSFHFYFYLCLLTKLFSHIDAVNASLQAKTLCFQEASVMISSLVTTIQYLRTNFDEFWNEITTSSVDLDLSQPKLPRQRRAPRRIDEGSAPHQYGSPKDFFKIEYFEVIDNVTQCV